VARQLVKVGGKPVWRQGCTTDNGNEILDVHELDIVDPPEMELRLNQIPGIVSVGLFARRPADLLLVAGDRGVTAIE
jgi:ribose 5-phosphate isomerase A